VQEWAIHEPGIVTAAIVTAAIVTAAIVTAAIVKATAHLVFRSEFIDVGGTEFRDLGKIEFVGLFPDYASAYGA
jgi:hypothetical protein